MPVDAAARQKQSAAVAKREIAAPALRRSRRHAGGGRRRTRGRATASAAGAMSPCGKNRCASATLPLSNVLASVKIGELPSLGCRQAALPCTLASRVRSSRSGVASQELLRRALPIERGLERGRLIGWGNWSGQLNTAVGVSMITRPAAFDCRRACRSSRADPARGRPARSPRSRNLARSVAAARDRSTVAARELNVHIHPFARGRKIAQPIAKLLLRHQPGERQQRLGAQVARLRAGVPAGPTRRARQLTSNSESGSRCARGERAHAPAEQRPSIGRVRQGQARR